jgi:NADH-quinone oxidoreductase subunit C
LAADLPGILVATPTLEREPVAPVKKGERLAPNLLATNDAVVSAERLPEAARYVRDTLGYTLLTNITATDYLSDGLIELIYHFVRVTGGAPLTLKARLERSKPEIASLTPWWPGADFQEREAFDLFGVIFTGHPNLRRIYMWDEFEGFPMRKDFPRQGDKYFGDS